MKLYLVLGRIDSFRPSPDVPPTIVVVPYGRHGALSVYRDGASAVRRAQRVSRWTLKEDPSRLTFDAVRVLPYHSEMGELDPLEMWASALGADQVK